MIFLCTNGRERKIKNIDEETETMSDDDWEEID